MLVAAALVGGFSAGSPVLPSVVLAAVAGLAARGVARRYPAGALAAAVFAVLIAATKFRMRDPMASLEGELDSQVVLELALFAIAGCFVAGALLGGDRNRPQRWRELRPSGVEWMLVAYVLLALGSVLWSSAPMLTAVRATELAVVLLLGVALRRVRGPDNVLDAIGAPLLVYVLGCAVLAKLFSWADGTRVDYFGFARFSWFAVHPIKAATAAAVAILYLVVDLSFAEDRSRLRRLGVPAWSLLLPLLVVLALTKSRGPLLALAASVAVLMFLRHGSRLGGALLFAAGAGLLLLVAVTGLTPSDLVARLGAEGGPLSTLLLRGQTANEVSGLTGRTELWHSAGQIIAANWAIGVGYQGSRAMLLAVDAWAAYAHNAFLQTLLDLGVVGTLLLWIPLSLPLFSGSLRDPAVEHAVLHRRAAALTMTVFLLVNSVSSESFAAAPGLEIMLAVGCILAVGRRTPHAAVARRLLAPAPRLAMGGS
ncbi:MAG TPA: O-antigen ligase family protein [Gemmatimonadaceae bacterium]|nr:O-antigen ligase family protein [Gemmatimonadaceae bacterium]